GGMGIVDHQSTLDQNGPAADGSAQLMPVRVRREIHLERCAGRCIVPDPLRRRPAAPDEEDLSRRKGRVKRLLGPDLLHRVEAWSLRPWRPPGLPGSHEVAGRVCGRELRDYL